MQHRYDRSARTPPVCCSELVNVNQMNCHCSCSTKLSACGGLKRFYTSSRSFSIINTRMKRLISWLEVLNTFVFSSKWLSVYETVRAEKVIRWSGDRRADVEVLGCRGSAWSAVGWFMVVKWSFGSRGNGSGGHHADRMLPQNLWNCVVW